MKVLINSRLFKQFRKSYLKRIKQTLLHKDNVNYCCHVETWHKFFICWKNLKEVETNIDSKYLSKNSPYTCDFSWFDKGSDRINFLDECLLK